MNEQVPDLKPTDLDYLTSDHHLQMMKAALPYMAVSEQRFLSFYIKVHELYNTASLFEDQEVATLGICSLDKKKNTPADMINAIRPYADPGEKIQLDLLKSILISGGKPPMEQLMTILSPTQQRQLENIELMVQAMQMMHAT